jgi:DNA-binding response OmpR family regulator
MDKQKILVVDDCSLMRQTLCDYFAEQFQMIECPDAESALSRLSAEKFDLVLLDLGLPKMDGHKLCMNIRQSNQTIPIIVFSGKIEIEDRLLAFSVGASDFVSKPADLRELKARIYIQLNKNSAIHHTVEKGPFVVDTVRQKIFLREGNARTEIPLSPLEFKICWYFFNHVEHVISREQLLVQVWGETRFVSDRCVDTIICKIRGKLGPYSNLLKSVRGVGYRFIKPETVSNRYTA